MQNFMQNYNGWSNFLKDHSDGKNNQSEVKKMKTFFLPVNKVANKIFSSVSSQSARQCLDSFVYTSQTMVKEIIWTLQIVHLDIPLDLMRVLLIVSKKNFPDSEIAKNMSTGKTKSMYLIKHGIASYLKSLLEADINKSD